MIKRFLQYIAPNWLVGTILVVVLILFTVVGFGISLYNDILTSKQQGFNTSKQIALENDLNTIESISRYHGDRFYHVVTGESEAGEKKIVFVPVNSKKNEKIKTFSAESLLTEEDILSSWGNSCTNCTLLGTSIAFDKDIPLVEVTYLEGENNFMVYEYFSLEDGQRYDYVKLRRNVY